MSVKRMRRPMSALVAAAALTGSVVVPAGAQSRAEGSAGTATAAAGVSAGAAKRPVATTSKDPVSVRRAAALAAVKSPRIVWQRCGGGIQCGELVVPLDYDSPDLGTVALSITRRPADSEKTRIGSLFTNPGGPGGDASSTTADFAGILGPEVRKRFDIVGLQPRGTGWGPEAARCTAVEKMPEVPFMVFPFTAKEQRQALVWDEAYRAACAQAGSRILQHMTTADTARDMDLARRALGDAKLSYYGVSYGSYLGATYAAMFPSKVRAVAVDGVIDPVAWATGRGGEWRTRPIEERLRSGEGAQEALMAAFAECERVGTALCPEAKTIRADWAALSARLRKGPIEIDDEFSLTYDLVIGVTLMVMYDATYVPELLTGIHLVREAVVPGAGAATVETSAAARERVRRVSGRMLEMKKEIEDRGIGLRPARAWDEKETATILDASFHGVMCSDSRNPADPQAWVRAAARMDKKAPGFGPAWNWGSSVCAGWPTMSDDAYRGPFTKKPANGLLVIGNDHDPATPIHGARALRELSPGSRMVRLAKGWGHGAFGQSTCTDAVRNRYLLTGALPRKDVTCTPDAPLFTRLSVAQNQTLQDAR